MPIKADLSHLPAPDKKGSDSLAPDDTPRFAAVLVEAWRDHEQAKGDLPRAFDDARFRHSDAGACARTIAYAALDIEPSDPMDLSGYWNTGLGSRIHDMFQSAFQIRWPNARIEQRVRTSGAPGAGHIDVVLPDDGKVISIELKSVGGFAFKMAVGERGAPQGPKHDHVLQAALNAAAVDADEAVVVYLAKEALSVNVAKRKGFTELGRFTAEWTFTRDEYLPLAEAEAKRIAGIVDLVDSGELPRRRFPTDELPKGHEIVDPTTGRWEVRSDDGDVIDTGTWWACGYCRYQTLCTQVGAGRVATSTATETAVQLQGVA